MMPTIQQALVTGASNQIGYFLLPRLLAAGFTVTAYSRQLPLNEHQINWQQLDLTVKSLSITQPSILFHLAPLPLLVNLIKQLPSDTPLKRLITFSSTSCFTKAHSPDPRERAIANTLIQAEQALIVQCQQRQITWTLFRPTLVYGCGRDKNVTFIKKFIQRFGFFPVVGQGVGLRQPVHADDLAQACLQACFTETTFNRAYNLSGAEILSYHQMVTAIFHSLQRKPRILSIPLWLFKFLLKTINWHPKYAHLSQAMIARMNQDLCFSHDEATHDFGYQPRLFTE